MTFWIVFLAGFLGSLSGVVCGYLIFGILGSRDRYPAPAPPGPKARSVQFLEQFERQHPYPVDENGQIDPDVIARSMPPGLTD